MDGSTHTQYTCVHVLFAYMVYDYVDHDLMFVYLYMKSVWDFFSFVVCDFVTLGIADHRTSVCGQ